MTRNEFRSKLVIVHSGKFEKTDVAVFDELLAEYDRLTAEVAALRERVAELEQAQRWVSVEERLPETQGLYTVYSPDVPVEAGNVWDCSYYVVFNKLTFASGYRITHWRPLPAPPEAE